MIKAKENCENYSQLLARLNTHTNFLIETIPSLIEYSKANIELDNLPGFRVLQQAPKSYLEVDGKPVLVIALVGPSGAGKSTVFNMLTGLNVPAGGAVRPMTYCSIAAIPEEIEGKIDLNELFPTFNITPLGSLSDLKNKNLPSSQLFYAPFKSNIPDQECWICLVDIPDFNTTETSNWEKANQMIHRADSVIFTVYHEAYKNSKTFEILKRCCRFSGHLTYLLSKLEPASAQAAAQEIWQDILNTSKTDRDFNEKRADGVSLASYLAETKLFFSPYSPTPVLENISSTNEDVFNFVSLFQGQKGIEILFRRQLQTINVGLKSCKEVCDKISQENRQAQEIISQVSQQIEEASDKIVGEEFPIFHVIAMLRKLLTENRPSLLNRIFKPVTLFARGLVQLASQIKNGLQRLTSDDIKNEVALRDELEKKRLTKEAEELINQWRSSDFTKGLDSAKCRKALNTFFKFELPPVDEEWDNFIREKLENWMKNNKNRWIWLNVINDLTLLAGSALVVGDFLLDGGIGTMGAVAAIGGSGMLGSFFLTMFNNMGLGKEILEAHNLWKKLRLKSYKNHFSENLARPLFLKEIEQVVTDISQNNLDKCIDTCTALERIYSDYD